MGVCTRCFSACRCGCFGQSSYRTLLINQMIIFKYKPLSDVQKLLVFPLCICIKRRRCAVWDRKTEGKSLFTMQIFIQFTDRFQMQNRIHAQIEKSEISTQIYQLNENTCNHWLLLITLQVVSRWVDVFFITFFLFNKLISFVTCKNTKRVSQSKT